jgi:hypothetical protein
MRNLNFLVSLSALFFAVTGYSQTLTEFKDTINGFSIGVPVGWTYKVPTDPATIKLMVWAPADSSKKIRENFNINIVDEPGINIDTVKRKLLFYLAASKDFQLIDSGSNYSNGQTIFWLDEHHRNFSTNDLMFSSAFVIYDNGKAYIFTAVGDQLLAAKIKPLFHQIGETLKAGATTRQEFLKIAFPETMSWKVIYQGGDAQTYVRQHIPVNDTKDNRKTLIHQSVAKNATVDSIQKAVSIFSEASRKETPLTKVTILKEVDLPDQKWAFFKVETPHYPNDPRPESQLWYLIQGKKGLHVAFVAIKEKQLSVDFVNKWSEIFKKSRLILE